MSVYTFLKSNYYNNPFLDRELFVFKVKLFNVALFKVYGKKLNNNSIAREKFKRYKLNMNIHNYKINE